MITPGAAESFKNATIPGRTVTSARALTPLFKSNPARVMEPRLVRFLSPFCGSWLCSPRFTTYRLTFTNVHIWCRYYGSDSLSKCKMSILNCRRWYPVINYFRHVRLPSSQTENGRWPISIKNSFYRRYKSLLPGRKTYNWQTISKEK